MIGFHRFGRVAVQGERRLRHSNEAMISATRRTAQHSRRAHNRVEHSELSLGTGVVIGSPKTEDRRVSPKRWQVWRRH